MSQSAISARCHPKLRSVFTEAEARHFSDDELNHILELYPDLEPEIEAAREIRGVEKSVVKKVVREVFSQYDYEGLHEHALAKCPRDVRYVVAYASHSMLARDRRWFDDKILVWLKTILQAFDFPERRKAASKALFADDLLEEALKELPKKSRSIYHCYYRIRQEMSKALSASSFDLFQPYLTQAMQTLSEEY